MKLLCLGDLHLRDSTPRSRIDNFCDTSFNKLEWCFDLAKKERCEYILFPGDITHSHRASYSVVSRLINLIKETDIPVLAIAGNHDQVHWSPSLENTPINVLAQAGFIKILGGGPYQDNKVNFYGASWGEEIPTIQDPEATNILLIHKMIIRDQDEKLWNAQENYVTARSILAKNKFDLIVSGDNHQAFSSVYKSKTLINCGSLTRMTSAQLDHKPQCCIYDTLTKSYETYMIPIEPVEEVFNLGEIEKAKDKKELDLEVNGSVQKYMDLLLNENDEAEYDFVSNLKNAIKQGNVGKEIELEIMEALED